MKEKFLKTIKKYNQIDNGDSIVVGVSGGPDSMCLLNLLNEIKLEGLLSFNIYVAHINHMIREEAIDDEKYVEEYCKNNDIPFFSKRIDIISESKKDKTSTEETGRNARYAFFEEVLLKTNSNKIATAHTANDNAETVLMNILRGSGTSGLKGIQPVRDNKFIRPLIEFTRIEIEEYCELNKLNPRIDKTNSENIYTRNKIRNMLIPYIQDEYNPNIIKTLNRLSEISSGENEYLDKVVENEYNKIVIKEEIGKSIELDLKQFNLLEMVIKSRIILYTINKLLGNCQGIELIHIKDIIKLCENNVGNKFLIPNKKVKILVKNKKIFFVSNM